MKRTKYHKILSIWCWIVLLLDLSVISVASWYIYVSISCCIFVIGLTSFKTYKRKFIALFLLILYRIYKNDMSNISGFCSLINRSFNFRLADYLKKKIEYIKPVILPTDSFYKDFEYNIGYWFPSYDWKIRIDYLKTILKE